MPDLWKYTRAQSDTDASTFFTACTAAGTTLNASQQSAIYFLVGGLKTLNLWSSMTALYPFIGGSAGAHAINLKSPGTYNIANVASATWTGMTHNSNGITGNGSTTYGDTGINASTQIGQFSSHLSTYVSSVASNVGIDAGCYTNSTTAFYFYSKNSGNCAALLNNASSGYATRATQKAGFFLASRTSSTSAKIFNQTASASSSQNVTTNFLPNLTVYIGGCNGALNSSAKTHSFFSIGSGLTDTQALNLNQIVQAYQTLLGRQV